MSADHALQITFWYPVEERSVRIAFVLASATAAGAFGGCIAYGVGHLNGAAGLEGFRWLFIVRSTPLSTLTHTDGDIDRRPSHSPLCHSSRLLLA